MMRLRGAILVAAVGLAVPIVWITPAFAARSLAVAPSTGLVDFNSVTIAGSGFSPSVEVGFCEAVVGGAADPSDCGSSVELVSTSPTGEFTGQQTARRFIHVPSLGRTVDCASERCVIAAAETSNVAATATISPISFAPAPPGETSSPPASSGYFSQLPAGSALPSPSSCASAVHRSSWEPRPDNQHWAKPSAFHVDSWDGVTTEWNDVRGRVTGDMGGFDDDGTPPETDEVVQFFACKWGLSDNWLRAEAIAESSWRQHIGGDWSTNFSWCAPGAPTRNSGTECAQSLGFMQIKTRFRPESIYPAIWDSLVAHLDYFGWELRGCIEGQKWVGSEQLSTPNDLRGCLGNWFSGGWYDAGAENYYATVKGFYDNRTWLSRGVCSSSSNRLHPN